MSNDENTTNAQDDTYRDKPHLSLTNPGKFSDSKRSDTNQKGATGHWLKVNFEQEARRFGFDTDRILRKARWLPKWAFTYPPIKSTDSERGYLTRVTIRVLLARSLLLFLLIGIAISSFTIWFSVNELIIKPNEKTEHLAYLNDRFENVVANTKLEINPINPVVPEWLWSRFAPSWYIEDAVYSSSLDLSNHDIELLSYLREKKAIVEREIKPAYSNDKIQNRLRDPNIIYFGSEYDRAYRRYVNMVLTIIQLNYEDSGLGQLDKVYSEKRRSELLKKITSPKPPEPNAHYDHRVDSLLSALQSKQQLYGEDNALIEKSPNETKAMLELLDDLAAKVPNDEFSKLTSNGLGPLLRKLRYGWGSTNLTRGFYAEKRDRYINWNILELRLLMLDLIYGAAELPQELPLVHLYLYHLGGLPYQTLFTEVSSKKLLADTVAWVNADRQGDSPEATREQRFIDEFSNHPKLKLDSDSQTTKRVALALILKAATFVDSYSLIESMDAELEARPYLGTLGSPVVDFKPSDIRPWGLFNARRNGYAHEGLDIGGSLGDPALAVMDGTIVRGGYQHRGAGNYLVLKQGNMDVTYMHLLREPSRSNYKRLLSREEIASTAKNRTKGYELALKKYASIILGKSITDLTDDDMKESNLRAKSTFNRLLTAIRNGSNPKVRKGDLIANIGMSGNVTLNSTRSEMIYPHIHLEINDGKIDPLKVIETIGSRWFEIKDHHLNHPFYRDWLQRPHNWSWYSKFYPNGAVVDDPSKN